VFLVFQLEQKVLEHLDFLAAFRLLLMKLAEASRSLFTGE